MKKDVIYIDVEDDLTAIIEKIKGATAPIVALVPPRRLGVLQSVVNLKLLKRAADEADKKAVLITSDQSLISLTAGIGLPVARNLQSRPEIVPESPEDLSEPDVIEGQMPIEGEEIKPEAAAAAPVSAGKPKPKQLKSGKKFKVPNFNQFRKRFIVIAAALVLLITFLVWAIFYAPSASIVIRAKSEKKEAKIPVVVDSELASTNTAEKSLKGELRQDTRNLTASFAPTGKKDVGERAKGSITIRNCDYSDGFTLQPGAQFTASSGQTYTSTQAVNVPKFSGSASSCSTSGSNAGTATVPVQATAIGEEYNTGEQSYSLPGITGKVDAVGTAMSGGSKRSVTVVTQDDVNKAKEQALAKEDKGIKEELIKQFDKSSRALEETYAAKQGEAAVQPAVGEEATGQATLTIPMTYTVLGVTNNDISGVLSKYFEGEISDEKEQRVYDNGYKKLKITIDEKAAPQKAKVTFETNGYIGPNIDTKLLASQVTGKRHGDIEAIVKAAPGVQDVESNFSPFWVTKAPKAEKVHIKLEVANEE